MGIRIGQGFCEGVLYFLVPPTDALKNLKFGIFHTQSSEKTMTGCTDLNAIFSAVATTTNEAPFLKERTIVFKFSKLRDKLTTVQFIKKAAPLKHRGLRNKLSNFLTGTTIQSNSCYSTSNYNRYFYVACFMYFDEVLDRYICHDMEKITKSG